MIDKSKWLKWAFLLAAVVSVFVVDWNATKVRSTGQLEENKRDLKFNWQQAKQSVELAGMDALPIQYQSEWETLDIYCVKRSGEFASKPRFLGDKWQGQSYNTSSSTLANSGKSGVHVTADYRNLEVISAYGPVELPDGETVALLVEMDVAEALSVAPPSYLDELLVTLFCSLTALIIFVVHRRLGNLKDELHVIESTNQPKENDTYYRMMVREFPDNGLMMVDADTDEIVECNTVFAKTVGYMLAAEVVGKSTSDFFQDEALPTVQQKEPVTCKDGSTKDALITIIKLNGKSMVRINFCENGNDHT